MIKQSSLLDLIPDQIPDLSSLPTAKVKKQDKVGVHAWTNFYASFSENFVNHALEALKIKEGDVLLDPFVGSGTSIVSALKLGIPAIGIDLDPFSCILTRSKVAVNAKNSDVQKILSPTNRKNPLNRFSSDAQNLFDCECLCYASTVFTRILNRTKSNHSEILDLLLSDRFGIYDSEVVALAALCIGAAESANVIKGSNPTWYRKAIDGEKDTFEELFKATQSFSIKMMADLVDLKPQAIHRDITVINNDVLRISEQIKNLPVSCIVTSPPYLTRLDYVIKHWPNLLILTGLIDVDINNLRKSMVGTTKIVGEKEFSPAWGNICNQTLEAIKTHNSYASESYYVWTYSQYFKAMFEFIDIIFNNSKKNYKGILVVQDSFYKDIQISLSHILQEMIEVSGYSSEVIKKDIVISHMKYINPNQQKNFKNKPLSENVIFFEKVINN